MVLPNYKDGSIVNLMSSISKAFGKKSSYKELKILPAKELNSKNVVLLVIDGLGYEYLKKHKNSNLAKHLKGSFTSVFPPTTASAITTFITGLAPMQHAITGWTMLIKEIGVVSKILPFVPEYGGGRLSEQGVEAKSIVQMQSLASKLNVKCYNIIDSFIIKSDFNKSVSQKLNNMPYKNLNGFFSNTIKAVKNNNKRKFVYAYWPDFDNFSHEFGNNSKQAEKHFWLLDRKFKRFIAKLKGTDSTIIVTADHGFIDVPKKKIVWLDNHPKLKECLTLPLCGESRVVYCYVHPRKTRQFENYVKTKLKKYCWMIKAEDAVKKGYFGLFEPNKNLFDRIGDYILVMKENYVIKDLMIHKKPRQFIGFHAGVSKEEMIVPLILVKV